MHLNVILAKRNMGGTRFWLQLDHDLICTNEVQLSLMIRLGRDICHRWSRGVSMAQLGTNSGNGGGWMQRH
jgi:hypothetical protein